MLGMNYVSWALETKKLQEEKKKKFEGIGHIDPYVLLAFAMSFIPKAMVDLLHPAQEQVEDRLEKEKGTQERKEFQQHMLNKNFAKICLALSNITEKMVLAVTKNVTDDHPRSGQDFFASLTHEEALDCEKFLTELIAHLLNCGQTAAGSPLTKEFSISTYYDQGGEEVFDIPNYADQFMSYVNKNIKLREQELENTSIPLTMKLLDELMATLK